MSTQPLETHELNNHEEMPVRPTGALPESLRVDVETLICDLAVLAGDYEAVYDALATYCRTRPTEDALGGFAATLLLTFGECMTNATRPGEYAGLNLPKHTTERTSA